MVPSADLGAVLLAAVSSVCCSVETVAAGAGVAAGAAVPTSLPLLLIMTFGRLTPLSQLPGSTEWEPGRRPMETVEASLSAGLSGTGCGVVAVSAATRVSSAQVASWPGCCGCGVAAASVAA